MRIAPPTPFVLVITGDDLDVGYCREIFQHKHPDEDAMGVEGLFTVKDGPKRGHLFIGKRALTRAPDERLAEAARRIAEVDPPMPHMIMDLEVTLGENGPQVVAVWNVTHIRLGRSGAEV